MVIFAGLKMWKLPIKRTQNLLRSVCRAHLAEGGVALLVRINKTNFLIFNF